MGTTTGCWSLGLIIGPAVGGLLANPAKLYPKTFVDIQLFVDFPYLLPNLITSAVAIIALLLTALFFPETLPPQIVLEDVNFVSDSRNPLHSSQSCPPSHVHSSIAGSATTDDCETFSATINFPPCPNPTSTATDTNTSSFPPRSQNLRGASVLQLIRTKGIYMYRCFTCVHLFHRN